MTVRELFDQIAMLGGKLELDSGYESFGACKAINRALFEVNRLFPVTKTIQLVHYPLAPVLYRRGIEVHKSGEDITIDATDARSVAFAVSGGAGRARVYSDDGNGLVMQIADDIEWDARSSFEVFGIVDTLHQSTSPTKLTLKFDGKYNYLIKDVSFYGELVSERAEDVKPYSEWIGYDINGVDYANGRFMAFASTPVRFSKVSLNSPYDYKIEGSVLYLRAEKPGVYELEYMVKPNEVQNKDNSELDIEPQLQDLVALRAAYYLYSMTDTEIAERCDKDYQRLLAIAIANARKVRTKSGYRDRKRW